MSTVELAAENALFTVFGEADPALLPRIVSLFAKCGLVPARFQAEAFGEAMHVEVEFTALSPARADHFADVIRQIPVVSLVRLRRAAARRAAAALEAGFCSPGAGGAGG